MTELHDGYVPTQAEFELGRELADAHAEIAELRAELTRKDEELREKSVALERACQVATDLKSVGHAYLRQTAWEVGAEILDAVGVKTYDDQLDERFAPPR